MKWPGRHAGPAIRLCGDAVASVDREAVEQAGAASRDQRLLPAPARGMRRIPGLRLHRVAQALAVDVAELRGSFAVLRPVAAGSVGAGCEASAFHRRAGERVMHVGRVAPAIDDLTLLVERGLLGEIVVAVELVNVVGNYGAARVLPGAVPDAGTGVDAGRAADALCAQVGAPGAVARAHPRCEKLAVRVRAREAAEIGAVAQSDTGDEERHVVLRLQVAARRQSEQQHRRNDRQTQLVVHSSLTLMCGRMAPVGGLTYRSAVKLACPVFVGDTVRATFCCHAPNAFICRSSPRMGDDGL